MRGYLAILAVVAMGLTGGEAAATGFTGDVVGSWGVEKNCAQGVFSYVRVGNQFTQVIEDNGKTYTSDIQVKVSGDILRVIDDEKMYTYRITGPDSMEVLMFTNINSGLSTHTKPRTWHRCS